MTVVIITSIVSPHQLPFARALAAVVGEDNILYLATSKLSGERKALGWVSECPERWISYVKPDTDGWQEQRRQCCTADVVICGERLWDVIEDRLQAGKLTFYMSERWWKPPLGILRMFHPSFLWMALRLRRMAKSPSFYYLAAGPYAARDMERIAHFGNRCRMWGYFPDVADITPPVIGRGNAEALRVLWAGRMLPWKQVNLLLCAIGKARLDDCDIQLTLVGDGPSKPGLVTQCDKLGIADFVKFFPSMGLHEVREMMRSSHVYVLPSNGYEGWGAVVNEAMSEGCTVVASSMSGAGKAIIRDGENGILFRPARGKRLMLILKDLYINEPKRQAIAKNGQNTIRNFWAPAVAARRLVEFSEHILYTGECLDYTAGPMSRFIFRIGEK